MGRVAFVFPGQGAQYPGMGKELSQISPASAEVFRMADSIRPGTSGQCFDGSEAELKETATTQPCMVAVEMAAAEALMERGVTPDAVAGFSLGELTALSFGGIVDKSTSFELVCHRGALMQAAAQQHDAAMAAVVKLTNQQVEAICAEFEGVYPVNYNCPGQVTVAMVKSQLAPFSAAVKAAGGRALPLKVSGGFHSPFMAEASEKFGKLLETVEFSQAHLPVYSNVTGGVYGESAKQLLAKQICSPVRWETIIRNMIDEGIDTFIEAGPGNVLQGLIRKIDPTVRVYGVSDRETLEKTVQEVSAC